MTHTTCAQPDAAATLAVGQLVRLDNPRDGRTGMSGTIVRITGNYALVTFTAWGTSHIVALADLIVVERGGR